MWVKICGTTNLPDALLAIEHGADALGFIFAPSKRRITAAQAAAIAAQLPPGIERVGVFTSASIPEILATVSETGLTAVQLHRAHDPVLTANLRHQLAPKVRIIQVVNVKADYDDGVSPTPDSTACNLKRLRAAFSDSNLWAVLLDAEKGGQSGGLGVAFSWAGMRPLLQQVLLSSEPENSGHDDIGANRPKLLLAGGLNAANIGEAAQTLRPWGVDCVSGVEAAPGHKDPVRLAAFLQAARLQTLSTVPTRRK